MTRKLVAFVTAATISLAAAAPAISQQDMSMGFNMLTGAVYNELVSRGLPTDNIQSLTLSQLAIIKSIIDSDDSEGKKTNGIKAILAR
jgi:hypothetical protein